jgi:hypothetical protein
MRGKRGQVLSFFCLWGEKSFLEQKDWGLEKIFLQSPSQNKNYFFTNQKRKLVS